MKFFGTVTVFVCLAMAAAIIMMSQPASAGMAVFYRNACAWSITKLCANKRAKGPVVGNGNWATRNGYSGYRGR
jgi:hypothetical protein